MRENLPGQEMHRLQEGSVLFSGVPESGLAGAQTILQDFRGVSAFATI